MDQHHERMRRITKQELITVMQNDREGWARAVEIVLSDKTDVFFAEHPEANFKDEFTRLLYQKEKRDSLQEKRLNELLIIMELPPNFLRQEILKTYANLKGYFIVEEG